MLVKTEGIVLQTLKYSESGIIAHILTKGYGLLSFIIKGVHGKKSKTKIAYFQPLEILYLEIYYKSGRNLQSVREVSSKVTLKRVHYDLPRNSMAFFIGEVLKKTLNEEEPDPGMYEYIYNSILFLDGGEKISNFHIGFLVGLARYMGIAPSSAPGRSDTLFDMQSGSYVDTPPLHGYYLDHRSSELLYKFSNSSISDCSNISLTGGQRSAFLESLLNYFSMHLPGLKKIKSLEVLTEVFNQ